MRCEFAEASGITAPSHLVRTLSTQAMIVVIVDRGPIFFHTQRGMNSCELQGSDTRKLIKDVGARARMELCTNGKRLRRHHRGMVFAREVSVNNRSGPGVEADGFILVPAPVVGIATSRQFFQWSDTPQ